LLAPGGWTIERLEGHPGDLHAEPLRSPVTRQVRWSYPDHVALVVGRAQRFSSPEDSTVAVVRRASGGGAVLVGPGLQVWADVSIPAGDPLWDVDVGRAAWWVGSAWVSALAGVGVPEASLSVHRGAMERTPWSDQVCFAGQADGEVLVKRPGGASGSGKSKVVGIAQRRTRFGALFQCAAMMAWEPVPLLRALGVPSAEAALAAVELADIATGLRTLVPRLEEASLEAAFEAALPA
jgi:lipoate-protein ligase A